jgi:hypothetical protein
VQKFGMSHFFRYFYTLISKSKNIVMKSPFPGMDPFLEGYLWPDVHNRLSMVFAELLAPQIAPKYVARLELYSVDDSAPGSEIGIMYPDVEIFERVYVAKEPEVAYGNTVVLTAPTVIIPDNQMISVRIPVIEIRDVAKNRLITAIEVLSPVNKRNPGIEQYRQKRMDLHRAGVHLLEIDLLRRGTTPFVHPRMPKSDYSMLLMRAGTRNTEVWAVNLQENLPVLPVPLVAPDVDVMLDLRKALDIIYERSLYQLSIDYKKQPPPPDLKEDDWIWMKDLLQKMDS